MKQNLPNGVEFFEKLWVGSAAPYYYVDKTSFLVKLLSSGDEVSLFTRPRRFGKTLMMTTLKYFLERGCNPAFFRDLEIAGHQELCDRFMGKYPVIFLTLKSVEGKTFRDACLALSGVIWEEANRHDQLLGSEKLSDAEKDQYQSLIDIIKEKDENIFLFQLKKSIRLLSLLLWRHYSTKPFLLIDEYDVPLQKSYLEGYYDEMVDLIRGMFGNAMKTNPYVERTVLTGCLRISKESIFTGINNFRVYSLLSDDYKDSFGFTEEEVAKLMGTYQREFRLQDAKEWYDGYRIGGKEIYCPWDIINFVSDICVDGNERLTPNPYWMHSSGNDLLIDLVRKTAVKASADLETLIAGGSLKKPVEEELTCRDLTQKPSNIWSVLLMTGYLTIDERTADGRLRLRIPNREVRSIIVRELMGYFSEEAGKNPASTYALYQAFADQKAAVAESLFNDYLKGHISIRDSSIRKEMKENFYHGYLLGILSTVDTVSVDSNQESGDGYADIRILDRNRSMMIIIEVKYAEDDELERHCQDALRQIRVKHYGDAGSSSQMEDCDTVLTYGVACYRKHCHIKQGPVYL